MLRSSKKRGKSTAGEKTMLDTFVPAVETLRKNMKVEHQPKKKRWRKQLKLVRQV
ncbi:MAG: DAK2 domain-containing protein [Anaerobutyricum soehngenii]